jgi:hypothetical protein
MALIGFFSSLSFTLLYSTRHEQLVLFHQTIEADQTAPGDNSQLGGDSCLQPT